MKLWNRVRFWLGRRRLDRELAAEVDAHRGMIEHQLREEGLSAEEAHAAALRQFGSDLAARERSRDEWGFPWLDAALRDFNQAIILNPDYAMAYFNRAVAHYHLKEYDEAWKDVRTCEKLGGRPTPDFLKALDEAARRPQ